MNNEQLRAYVAGLYKGPRWAARVNLMSDSQIYAIYMQKKKYDEENPPKKENDEQDELPF
jgi:hypothetical protein